jgi:peptide/nickel transport system permease protein
MAFFKLLKQSPLMARIGLVMILINVFAAIFAPVIAPYGETEIVGDVWLPSSRDHLLGTDHIGRDMFTRLMYGARNTIAIAFITTMLAFFLGAFFGFFAATLGGWTDLSLSRVVDIVMSFPSLIFALIVLSVVGTSVGALIMTIAVLESTRVFRLSRAVAMDIEVMEFLFRIFIHRCSKFSGFGYSTPYGGLGRHGTGKCRGDHLRHIHPAMAGRGNRVFDCGRQLNC